jgi:hypothetical protein
MAKLQEDVLVIKVSKLVKDSDSTSSVITEEFLASVEAVIAELAGADVLVELSIA